jgi:enoyl-CoA hydratase
MPGWGLSQKLSRIIGISRAKQLSFTGNFLDAATAERWGLVNQVVAPNELMPLARKLAADIASVDPDFMLEYKALIDGGYAESLSEALLMEHKISSVRNAAVSPAQVEARRAEVQARGRTQ